MSVEFVLASLVLAVVVTVFKSYYETAIGTLIDLCVLTITKVLTSLQSINQPTEKPKKPKPGGEKEEIILGE